MNRYRKNTWRLGIVLTSAVFGLLAVLICCSPSDPEPPAVSATDIFTAPSASDKETQKITEQDIRLSRASEIASQMSLEELAGQVILVRGDHIEQTDLCELISDIHAGGVVLFRDNFRDKTADEVRAMTAQLQQSGGGDLLLCVDEEGGKVVRVSSNPLLRSEKFASPQELYASGGLDAVAADTHDKCAFLLDLGINVNFAPVADVVTEKNGFLYERAFGMDALSTAAYVKTVVGVMSEYRIGCSIKHFPGYGNASGDTHGELVTSAVTAESLYSNDLVPFRAGIAAGADSVMLTHTIIDALDSERPASISPAAVSLLRGEMHYDGVLITDGLDMDAIEIYCGDLDPGTAAISAGLDLLCTPADPRETHAALLEAIENGQLSEERLRNAAEHVIAWKLRLGLMR